MTAKKIRIAKALAEAGLGARRKCEELVFAGKVKVNGKVIDTPALNVDLARDRVTVSGKRIRPEKKVYFLLNKPLGYHCTNKRPGKNAKIILDLFPDINERIFSVGRLDKYTGGLLFVTNDGDFAQQLIHPSSNITKEYLAKTRNDIDQDHLVMLSEGVTIDGVHVKPVKVKKMRKGTVKIAIKEGKKHEVRLLLEHAGLTLKELTRIRIGSFLLGKLNPGEYRELTKREIEEV